MTFGHGKDVTRGLGIDDKVRWNSDAAAIGNGAGIATTAAIGVWGRAAGLTGRAAYTGARAVGALGAGASTYSVYRGCSPGIATQACVNTLLSEAGAYVGSGFGVLGYRSGAVLSSLLSQFSVDALGRRISFTNQGC